MLQNGEGHVELNGISHWYRVAGAEQETTPVVVVHGGPGGNTYNFERVVGPRLERFATMVYYDQRGCGRSAAPVDRRDYSLALLVSDLDELRRHLEAEQVVLLGFSFGGALALEYALAQPEHVASLILEAPGFTDKERVALTQIQGFLSVATGEVRERILAALQNGGTPSDQWMQVWGAVDTPTVDQFLFHNEKAAGENRRLWNECGLKNNPDLEAALDWPPKRVDHIARLRGIAAPTLVLAGLYDRNVGVDLCRDISCAVQNGRLVVFSNSAHFPDAEEPEAFAAAVREFLSQPDARPGSSCSKEE